MCPSDSAKKLSRTLVICNAVLPREHHQYWQVKKRRRPPRISREMSILLRKSPCHVTQRQWILRDELTPTRRIGE